MKFEQNLTEKFKNSFLNVHTYIFSIHFKDDLIVRAWVYLGKMVHLI